MTTTQKNIDSLTGLRGIAALWVMLYHSWIMIIPILGFKKPNEATDKIRDIAHFDVSPIFTGWGGVEVFFVLTGFLLFLPFVNLQSDVNFYQHCKYYFKRRCLRILPAYYTQMGIIALLVVCGVYEAVPWTNWLAHIFMVHNFSARWTGNINGVWWTLPIEFDFYLALPLLFLGIRKIGIIYFTLATLAFVITYKWLAFPFIAQETVGYKAYVFGQLAGRLDLFAYGMMAAVFYNKYGQRIGDLKHRWFIEWGLIVGGIIGMWEMLSMAHSLGGLGYWKSHFIPLFFDSLYGFFIFLLVLGISLDGELAANVFGRKTVIYLGKISYGIYLWHIPFLRLIFENRKIVSWENADMHVERMVALVVFYTCATLLTASASYYFIEKPFLRKKLSRHDLGVR